MVAFRKVRDVTAIARELAATVSLLGCNEIYISARRMWELKDIGKLLHKGMKEKRSVRSEKLDKLREKAKRLGVRMAELGARKEKYKAMENEGKMLPATWKSFARLEGEEQGGRAFAKASDGCVCVGGVCRCMMYLTTMIL